MLKRNDYVHDRDTTVSSSARRFSVTDCTVTQHTFKDNLENKALIFIMIEDV